MPRPFLSWSHRGCRRRRGGRLPSWSSVRSRGRASSSRSRLRRRLRRSY